MLSDKLKAILKLLRIRQYYKNVLIFGAIFFSKNLLDFSLYPNIIIGFIVLCCASSLNYIINDIKDIEKDRIHPEKQKKKPLASGELSVSFAIILILILTGIIVVSLIFFIQNIFFIFTILLLIITGQMYNLILKNYPFVDLITLSFGYLWRTLAGCVIIGFLISPWLFLAIFEVAMFLVIAKRRGDLTYLGKDKAFEHKKVYNQYSQELLVQLHNMIATALFITYSLYLINKFDLDLFDLDLFGTSTLILHEYMVILSIPFALYIIMRFMYLTSTKPEIARHAEKIFFDKGIFIAGVITFCILTYSFYFDDIIAILFPGT
jgi:4-hydroxybenzoate polyprenyltransferase